MYRIDVIIMSTYRHLRCTSLGPYSSYSSLVSQYSAKCGEDDKREPPIHVEYLQRMQRNAYEGALASSG